MEQNDNHQVQLYYPECYYPQNMTGKHQLLTINPGYEKVEQMPSLSEAEKYFLNELNKYPQICEEFEILSGGRIATDSGYYFPRIVLVTKEGTFNNTPGNYFDIEIDTPRDSNSGEPIHYLEQRIDGLVSTDKEINDFLSSKGWTVIRFTENQVLGNTFECVKIISKTQVMLEHGSHVLAQSYVKSFPVKKWTKDEVLQSYTTERKDAL